MNIILGGTHGLGAEIASKLHEQGSEVFVIGRSYDEQVHGAGMRADLAERSDVDAVATYILDLEKSALEGFYLVSGYGYNGDFASQPAPSTMGAVNFGNTLDIAQAAWQKLTENPASTHFVVIASSSGIKARQDEAVYAGTKHAQVGFTRSLGLEAERLKTSVRVALFLPGGMQTPFWKGNEPDTYKDFLDPKKVADRVVRQVLEQNSSYYEEDIPRGSL